MPTAFAMVLTTCGNKADAEMIAGRLVENRLAACVQMFPIASVYRWEGTVERAEEWMLFCKIRSADYANVEAALRAVHPYTTPEIIAFPIDAGAAEYLNWIGAVTSRQ